jgi:hypothetical protein
VTLRKMAIKKAVKDELGKIGPDPLVKVPEANPKWLKGFEKTERFCEHQRKKNIKWSYNKLAKLQPQRKPLELVFTPRKLYLLGAEESAPGKNDNSTTDDLFIGIWPKRITNTEIPVKGLDNSRKLELSRIPKTTRIFATEYSTMSTPWEIDCNRNKGQYLYAYTRNGVTNKISERRMC